MVKNIVCDNFLLSRKSTSANREDFEVIINLLDTIKAHENECVGMAANMIGVCKTILVVEIGSAYVPMVNPKITKYSKETYEAEEGCLSHTGTKKTMRFESITVEYLDINFKPRTQTFSGFTAQIIQHEMDHFNGILI